MSVCLAESWSGTPKPVMRGLDPRTHAVPPFRMGDLAHDPRDTGCGGRRVGGRVKPGHDNILV